MIHDLNNTYTYNAKLPPPATMVKVAGGGCGRRKRPISPVMFFQSPTAAGKKRSTPKPVLTALHIVRKRVEEELLTGKKNGGCLTTLGGHRLA